MTPQPDYVRIFDTTLRDGEQSPGATMTSAEKREVAVALARLGVDVIVAGFPAASPDDLAAVRMICERVGRESLPGRASPEPPIVCGLARAAKGDIDRAWEALRPAKHPRIHTFLATSEIHLKYKLRMTREEVLLRVGEMVAYARSRCEDVEFSPEDAGRSDPEFLYRVLDTAIRAGAMTLNIPDTVGYTTPDEFGALIAGILEHVPGARGVVISVHCHDDLGLATANSLAGIRAGARQAEVTVNGIGERAGNTSLEELVMALETRRAKFGLRTGVDTTQLVPTSRVVMTSTGIVVPPNKAIVGANAFAHESGIHQDGMLKHEETYEIMRPETVGANATELVLGKHSGRAALSARLRELGHELTPEGLDKLFARFKAVAERKKQLTVADLEALVHDEAPSEAEAFVLVGLQVACGTSGMPTATVRVASADGKERTHAAVGTGPVDAAFKAVDALVGGESRLLEFNVHSVTEGIDAIGQVSVRVEEPIDRELRSPTRDGVRERRIFSGHGADTDIVVASVKAYLKAKNRMLVASGAAEKECA